MNELVCKLSQMDGTCIWEGEDFLEPKMSPQLLLSFMMRAIFALFDQQIDPHAFERAMLACGPL